MSSASTFQTRRASQVAFADSAKRTIDGRLHGAFETELSIIEASTLLAKQLCHATLSPLLFESRGRCLPSSGLFGSTARIVKSSKEFHSVQGC